MREPHITLWIGEIEATRARRLTKRQVADFRVSVDRLVAFAKERGLPVEDWSMFGDTRLTLDVPFGPDAVSTVEQYIAADPPLPPIGHVVFSKFDPAAVESPAVIALFERLGLKVDNA